MINSLDFTYEGDMTARYIAFPVGEEDFREAMLIHNDIWGHLPLKILDYDGKKNCFDISGKKSLREMLEERPVSAEIVSSMLKRLEQIFLAGQGYMLEETGYLIHPDALYYDDKGEVYVVYLPGSINNVHDELSDTLNFIMNYVSLSNARDVYLMYLACSAIKENNCTFASIYNLLEKGMISAEGLNFITDKSESAPGNIKKTEDINKDMSNTDVGQDRKLSIKDSLGQVGWKIMLGLTFAGVIFYFLM